VFVKALSSLRSAPPLLLRHSTVFLYKERRYICGPASFGTTAMEALAGKRALIEKMVEDVNARQRGRFLFTCHFNRVAQAPAQ
jgi:hypothetical protein